MRNPEKIYPDYVVTSADPRLVDVGPGDTRRFPIFDPDALVAVVNEGRRSLKRILDGLTPDEREALGDYSD